MSGFRIEGNTSSNVAEVDADHNLSVNLPLDMQKAGYDVNIVEIDPGSITGTSLRRAPYITQSRRTSVGLDTAIFDYTFNAATQDTGMWACKFTTMAISQSSGSLLMNGTFTGTSLAGCSLSTWRYFQLLGGCPLRISITMQITAAMITNQIWEGGLFVPTTTIGPTDGVYFRLTGAGFIGVINYNGVETTSGVLIATPAIANTYDLIIIVGEANVEFWADPGNGSVLLGEIAIPASQSDPFITTALPLTVQMRNSALVSGSPCAVKVTDCNIQQKSLQLAIPYSHQMVMQKGNGQGLSGGTMGTLALYANNQVSGAGTALSNTSVAGFTGLGGQFAAIPSLAVGTDGIICSYQNPLGGINQTPRTYVCTGVKIHSVVTTVLAGGPVVYAYSLAYNHSLAAMTTAESASFATSTLKSPRRQALGFESFPATAAVGTLGSPSGIYMGLNAPLIINPGEFLAVCAKNLGTTATGVIVFHVTFDGYWI